jgi:hypothetical protein
MALIACAELSITVPIQTAFARFIDFSTWDQWMPRGFRPISGPARQLREGDHFTMALGAGRGLPSALTVIRLRPHREVCWKGGIPNLLVGEHSFFFNDEGRTTRVRSEEPFTGLLTLGPIGTLLRREAEKSGEHTLANFAAYLAKQP